MGLILVGCALLGFLCICGNLLEMIGKVVIALLKYVIGPVVFFVLLYSFIQGLK